MTKLSYLRVRVKNEIPYINGLCDGRLDVVSPIVISAVATLCDNNKCKIVKKIIKEAVILNLYALQILIWHILAING